MKKSRIRWNEFLGRLEGPEGCNFRDNSIGEAIWNCPKREGQSRAKRILRRMGYSPAHIKRVLQFCTENGGYCDCTIVFNVREVVQP